MSVESEIKKLTEAITNHTEVITNLIKKEASIPTASSQSAETEAKETTNSEPAAGAVADIFGDGGNEPLKTSTPKPTINDVKVTLKSYMDKHGDNKALELLQKYGVQRITDLKEEDYAKLIAAASA